MCSGLIDAVRVNALDEAANARSLLAFLRQNFIQREHLVSHEGHDNRLNSFLRRTLATDDSARPYGEDIINVYIHRLVHINAAVVRNVEVVGGLSTERASDEL